MFCPKCGTQIPDDVSFCGECGTAIVKETVTKKTVSQNDVASQAANPIETSPTSPASSQSSSVTAAVGSNMSNGKIVVLALVITLVIIFSVGGSSDMFGFSQSSNTPSISNDSYGSSSYGYGNGDSSDDGEHIRNIRELQDYLKRQYS